MKQAEFPFLLIAALAFASCNLTVQPKDLLKQDKALPDSNNDMAMK